MSLEDGKVTPPFIKSPSIQKRIINHNIDLADEKYNNTWTSCCVNLDRRAVQYFTQIVVISSIMGFSIYQLLRLDTCEGQQAYMGLLTFLIGILIPSPKFSKI